MGPVPGLIPPEERAVLGLMPRRQNSVTSWGSSLPSKVGDVVGTLRGMSGAGTNLTNLST